MRIPDREEEFSLYRLGYRVEALERDFVLIAARLRDLAADVNALTVEERIQEGVRNALEDREEPQAEATAEKVRTTGANLRLTLAQKIGGGIAGAIIVIDSVRGLLH